MSSLPLYLRAPFCTSTFTSKCLIDFLTVHSREIQYLTLMYTMYTSASNYTPSYTHGSSYMVGRVHPLRLHTSECTNSKISNDLLPWTIGNLKCCDFPWTQLGQDVSLCWNLKWNEMKLICKSGKLTRLIGLKHIMMVSKWLINFSDGLR